MKKTIRFNLNPIYIACFFVLTSIKTYGAPLDLAQSPPTSTSQEPAPNVLLSIDDSGSMETSDVNGMTRMEALKQTLRNQFGTPNSKGKVADDKIRLAWQVMCARNANTLLPGAVNSMRFFSGVHRNNFVNFIDTLEPNCGTPSHEIFKKAHRYMLTPPGLYSPFADNPDNPSHYLACRRSYHIFLTDGDWSDPVRKASSTDAEENSSTFNGNIDGTERVLGDGMTKYTPHTAQTRVYSDFYGSTSESALADWPFLSWSMDLQPNIENNIKPLIKKKNNETVGGVSLEPFWNPKNDPATWQHLTTFTIGFGVSASSWGSLPRWDGQTDDTYQGDFSNLVNGSVQWGNPRVGGSAPTGSAADYSMNRAAELWHMALNGRGKYYPVRTVNALDKAFASILDNISTDTSKPITVLGSGSSTLTSDTQLYTAGYSAANWSGSLVAYPIKSSGEVGSTILWDAAAKLNAKNHQNRFIVSYYANKGFLWNDFNNLPNTQKQALNKNNKGEIDNLGSDRLHYLRGDKSKETTVDNGVFREREFILGDIVNSSIWHVGAASGRVDSDFEKIAKNRTKMIYVGANDGMLHGFNAENGEETLAYIPQSIAENHLRNLTDPDYTHRYYVDGPVFSGDMKLSNNNFKTLLVGSLGAGGKGYFILDATNPSSFDASNLVYLDTTAATDADNGHIFSPPALDDAVAGKSRQFVLLNNDRPALILGNGYNSANEDAVLLIQYLDGAKEIIKIKTNSSGGNGLSTPQPIDLNGDGKIDVVYAGDLKGNLWKFNLASSNTTCWKLGTESNKPLFTAKYNNQNQAITTAPTWIQHPLGGLMLIFGTGQLLTNDDPNSTQTQSIYGIYDSATFGVVNNQCGHSLKIEDSKTVNLSELVEQKTSVNPINGIYYQSSKNDVDYQNKKGWYLNYTLKGQRVTNKNPQIFSGQLGMIWSNIPMTAKQSTQETCEPTSITGQRHFVTVLNLITGKPAQNATFTTDNSITTQELLNMSGGGLLFTTDKGILISAQQCEANQPNCSSKPISLSYPPTTGKQTGWRIIRR